MTVADYYLPTSVPDALDLLAAHGPELLVIAGGTVAMPLINEGISLPRRVMGLRRAGLDGVVRVGDELHLGATATLSSLQGQEDIPMLAQAAGRTASWSVRNMGTVGGNLFTPPPGGDVGHRIAGPRCPGRRDRAGRATGRAAGRLLDRLHDDRLAADELVTSIVVPVDAGRTAFVKFGRRAANTPAVVMVAVHATFEGDTVTGARIALGAAGPHPLRMARAEAAITGTGLDEDAIAEAATLAAEDADPEDDAIASAWYRRRMVGVFVRRALLKLAEPAGRGA